MLGTIGTVLNGVLIVFVAVLTFAAAFFLVLAFVVDVYVGSFNIGETCNVLVSSP